MGNGVTSSTGVCGGCKVIEPRIRPLSERQLGALTEADRILIERVLCEPVEYIDHQLFTQPNVENTLFGEKAALASGTNHFQDSAADPAPDQLHEGTSLNSAQEILLFQRFNYARLRISRVIAKYEGKALSNEAVRELVGWAHRASIARGGRRPAPDTGDAKLRIRMAALVVWRPHRLSRADAPPCLLGLRA